MQPGSGDRSGGRRRRLGPGSAGLMGDGEETGGCTSPMVRPRPFPGPQGGCGRESAHNENEGAAAGSGGSSSLDAPAAGVGGAGVVAAGSSQGTPLGSEWGSPRTGPGLGAGYPATETSGHPDSEWQFEREQGRSGVA